MKTNPSELCPLCGGHKVAGRTTFTADLGTGIVVVRNVRATVCSQCGEDWIDNETALKLEQSVSVAREKRSLIEVTAAS